METRTADKVVRLVKKSNDLVEARYKFDIWETRIFTSMISMIRKDDHDFKDYRLYVNDLVKEYGLDTSNSSYERLKSGARDLMKKVIKVVRETEAGPMEFTTNVVVGIEHPLNATLEEDPQLFIDLNFHPKMKPYLLALKSRFTSYDIRNVLRLPSSYSIRIYELLKQYERIGKRKLKISDLKQIIGAIQEQEVDGKNQLMDTYPRYSNFRQKVLLPAQEHLKKYSDLYFDFAPIKKGRRYEEIEFHIHVNKGNKGSESSSKEEDSAVFDHLWPRVSAWEDMTEPGLKNAIKSYSKNQLLGAYMQTVDDYENRKATGNPIKSRTKYFYKLAQVPTLFDEVQQKRSAQEEIKRSVEAQNRVEAERQNKLKSLQRERGEKIQELVDLIVADQPSILEDVITQYQRSRPNAADTSREDLLRFPPFLGILSSKVMTRFPEKFEPTKQHYDAEIRKLRAEHADI